MQIFVYFSLKSIKFKFAFVRTQVHVNKRYEKKRNKSNGVVGTRTQSLGGNCQHCRPNDIEAKSNLIFIVPYCFRIANVYVSFDILFKMLKFLTVRSLDSKPSLFSRNRNKCEELLKCSHCMCVCLGVFVYLCVKEKVFIPIFISISKSVPFVRCQKKITTQIEYSLRNRMNDAKPKTKIRRLFGILDKVARHLWHFRGIKKGKLTSLDNNNHYRNYTQIHLIAGRVPCSWQSIIAWNSIAT